MLKRPSSIFGALGTPAKPNRDVPHSALLCIYLDDKMEVSYAQVKEPHEKKVTQSALGISIKLFYRGTGILVIKMRSVVKFSFGKFEKDGIRC